MGESTTIVRKEYGFALILIIIVLVAGILAIQQRLTGLKQYQVGEERVTLEVANTSETRQKGLSGRDAMGDADGMIFIFNTPGRHGIWMKDVRFPIDIIWVGSEKVIDIAPNVAPPEPGTLDDDLDRYYPRLDANRVIELPAGWAEEHGLKIGDLVARVR